VTDCRRLSETDLLTLVRQSIQQCAELRTQRRSRMLRPVLLAGPQQAALWSPESSAANFPEVLCVTLTRLDPAAVDAWKVEDGLVLRQADDRHALLARTGGWPVLVNNALRLFRVGRTWRSTLEQVEQQLAVPDAARLFVEAALGGNDDARAVAEFLVDMGEVTWPDLNGLWEWRDPAKVRGTLSALAVTDTVGPDSFRLEPVLEAALQTLHSQ
jgi:hypothetical protein